MALPHQISKLKPFWNQNQNVTDDLTDGRADDVIILHSMSSGYYNADSCYDVHDLFSKSYFSIMAAVISISSKYVQNSLYCFSTMSGYSDLKQICSTNLYHFSTVSCYTDMEWLHDGAEWNVQAPQRYHPALRVYGTLRQGDRRRVRQD